MTDNERHDRLAVLRERCQGCRWSRPLGPDAWLGGTMECEKDHDAWCRDLADYWDNHCVVASIETWNESTRNLWWELCASPRLCLAMTDRPCPKYGRVET